MYRLLFLFIPFLLFSEARPLEDQLEHKIGLKKLMRENHCKGLSLAVINEGKISWVHTWGGVFPDTQFQAGALSQWLAGTLAVKMVQERRIIMDESVNPHLKRWKLPSDKITLKMLLTHTSGLNNAHFKGYPWRSKTPSILEILKGEAPANNPAVAIDGSPGGSFHYSSGGYEVIRLLIEDLLQKSYYDEVVQTIFRPLKMDHSTFGEPLTPYASGYIKGERIKFDFHVYPEYAASGLWTTPTDFSYFLLDLWKTSSINTGKLLSQENLRKVSKPNENNWGLGPQVVGEGHFIALVMQGKNEGYSSIAIFFPYLGKGAVIMTNSEEGNLIYPQLIQALGEMYDFPPATLYLLTH